MISNYSRVEIRNVPCIRCALRSCGSFAPLAAIVILASSTWLHADGAIDRLVRLVGRDAGLCVEVSHLDETVSAFEEGEFFQRLRQSQIYADWQAGEHCRQVKGVVRAIENFTSKPCRQFFREVFGSAAVIAVYPAPDSRMSSVLLTETASRQILDDVIEGWNKAEPQTTEKFRFAGQSYYKRTCESKERPGGSTLFYAKLDRTLLLSDREEWVRRSLELFAKTASHDSLLDLPAYQQALGSLQPGSAARAFINPRAWDSVLDVSQSSGKVASGAEATSGGSVIARTLASAWRHCDWVAVGLQTDRGIVVEAVAHYSTSGLSETAKQFIQSMSGPAEFLHVTPQDALIVLAGRQGLGKLLRKALPLSAKGPNAGAWESFRQVSRGLLLGWDLYDDVLPALGDNWGAYVVGRPDAKADQLPFNGVIALELPPMGDEKFGTKSGLQPAVTKSDGAPVRNRPSLREAIDNGLNTGLNFVAAYLNMNSTGKPAVVQTDVSHGTRIRWIESNCPYQAAFGLTSRFLVVATDPQAIRNFTAREKATQELDSSAVPPAISTLANRYFPKENQLLFVNMAAIRQFLKVHGTELIDQAVRCRSIDPQHAKKALVKFLDVAGLFDSVFAAGRIGDGSARVVIGGVVNKAAGGAARRVSAAILRPHEAVAKSIKPE